MNYEGQLCAHITEKTGIMMDQKILKWSGRQFTANELFQNVQKFLNK
jgi:hypothetical protein